MRPQQWYRFDRYYTGVHKLRAMAATLRLTAALLDDCLANSRSCTCDNRALLLDIDRRRDMHPRFGGGA